MVMRGIRDKAAIVGIGQTIVVLQGGIDLSVAAVIGLAGVVGGNLISQFGQEVGITLTLIVAALVGIINGLGTIGLRLPPLIMTLATSAIIDGALRIYNSGNPVSAQSPLLQRLALDDTWGIPNSALLALAIAIVMMVILHGTAFGRSIYAIGVNPQVAYLSGIPVGFTQLATYAISSVTAAIVGLLLLGQTGYSFQDMGTPYLLQSIAVVVLGGTSILGGRGKLVGTLAAALFMIILTSWLQALRVSEAFRLVAQGLLLLLLLIAYGLTNESSESR